VFVENVRSFSGVGKGKRIFKEFSRALKKELIFNVFTENSKGRV